MNGQNVVQIWDLATGAAAGPPLPHPGDLYGIFSVAFSPDSQQVLTGHKDGQVRLWDWRTGKLVGHPLKHPEEVYQAKFTDDGRYVVAAVRNSTIHLWDLATGKPAAPPLRYPDSVPEFSCGPLALAGSRIIACAIGHPIFDLSRLLEPAAGDVASLLSRAELATNQRLIAGELAPLAQSEWDERWANYVAVRQTPAAAAEELARSLDVHTENSARLVIARRALQINVIERLIELRPQIPQLRIVFADELDRRHEPLAAAEQRRLAMDAFQVSLRDRAPDPATAEAMARLAINSARDDEWVTLEPTETKAETGCTFTVASDGSIVADYVPNAKGDSYSILCRSPIRQVAALQLQVLPHNKMPNRGPGWSIGNFVLTEVRATLQRSDGTTVSLAFRAAAADVVRPADHDTTPWDGPWGTIDGDDSTRWDIWPHPGQSHWLKLQLNEPVDIGETDQLLVQLEFHSPFWGDNRLGHFRLQASAAEQDFVSQHGRTAVRGHAMSGLTALAAAYLSTGDAKRAAEVLALSADVKSSGAEGPRLLLRAWSQQLLGQTDVARGTLDRLLVWLRTEPLPQPLDQLCMLIAPQISGLSREQLLDRFVEAAIERRQTELNRDVERGAGSAAPYAARGSCLSQLGRWSDSAADYLRAVERDPQNVFLFENGGVALVLAGDQSGFQRHCRSMLDLLRKTTDPTDADLLCMTCLLGQNAIEPSELPDDVPKSDISDRDLQARRLWFRAGRALVSYRGGKYRDALNWTDETRDDTSTPNVVHACRLAVRAMAEQQLGQTESACQTLAAAVALIPAQVRNLGQADSGSQRPAPASAVYGRWLLAECLRREAAALVQPENKSSRVPSAPDKADEKP